jgi:hypothetical protein
VEETRMTLVEIVYRYGRAPGEPEMRALKEVREVYGIWRVSFDEVGRLMRIEYDASRLDEGDVAALLRNAGFDVAGRVDPVAPPLAA